MASENTLTSPAEPIKRFDMRVAAKMLQNIASGIYRSPANAVKELVSNAFDADATHVAISVDIDRTHDRIENISIEDNGTGMSVEDFEFSMTHIGASLKRVQSKTTEKGRPLIGKIGIGLLSVGQASNNF